MCIAFVRPCNRAPARPCYRKLLYPFVRIGRPNNWNHSNCWNVVELVEVVVVVLIVELVIDVVDSAALNEDIGLFFEFRSDEYARFVES